MFALRHPLPWSAVVLLAIFLGPSAPATAEEPTAPSPTTNPAKAGIITINESGAWTWFNDPRAIVVDDLLIVGSVDREGYSRVDLLDLKTRQPVDGGGARLSTLVQRDDHNNPALLHLGDGRVLAAWSRHGSDRFWSYRIGTLDPDRRRIEWGDEQRYELAAGSTYCNLLKLPSEEGRIYNFIRGLNFNPNVITSEDGGASWSQPAILFQTGRGSVRPYVRYASDGAGRIDFLLTEGHPRDVRTGILHAYYQDGKLHQTDGSEIAPMPGPDHPPVAPDSATRIYDGSRQRAWVWDIAHQRDGSPVAVFVVAADDEVGEDLRYHYARWDAQQKQWIQRQFAHAGRHLYRGEDHYAGGVTLDPQDPGTVYFSSNVDPATGAPTEIGRYQIYRGRTIDGGETWKFEQLTHSADEDNLRPYALRSHPLDVCVLWFRGAYRTYADYETRVVGLLEER